MSDIYQPIYQRKRMSATDAMSLVENGDFICVPTGVGEPPALLTALSEQRQTFHGVTVGQILPLRKFGYIDPATVDHVPKGRSPGPSPHPRGGDRAAPFKVPKSLTRRPAPKFNT